MSININSRYPELNNPKWIREQYDDNLRSVHNIANEIGCSCTALLACMDRSGIRRRPLPEYPALNDAVWLRAKYEVQTVQAIADEVGCSRSTVHRAMDRHGIKRNNVRAAHAFWPGHEGATTR